MNVRTPFADPAQAPMSQPPSPSAAPSPLAAHASHGNSTASDPDMSVTGSLSYGTPVATPSAGRSWIAGSAFVTPTSLVSAASGTSWMSAADTLATSGLHQSAALAPEATLVDTAARQLTPRLGSAVPPDSPSAQVWRRPRAAQPAVIVEVDDINVQSAAGVPDASVAAHIQEVAAWETGALCAADERASWSPCRAQAGVFSVARGTKLLHSVASSAWPPPSARGPHSSASAMSRTPSMAGSDRGPSSSIPGQPTPASPFRLPHVRPRPSSGALARHDTLPRSARPSSHLSRSGSLSLLQVQSRSSPFTSAAAFGAPQFGPPPLVSISTCMSPMHSEIDITPLTVTITPRLMEFALKSGEPFERLLPQPVQPTALPLPPQGALVAAADAALELAAAPKTVSLRVRGVAVGVVLSTPSPAASAAGCEIVPHLSVDEVRLETGSVSDPCRIARLRDDLRTAHAYDCLGTMHVSGHYFGVSSAACSGPDVRADAGEGLAGELWVHAGAAGAVRLPDAALAAALTVPLHASAVEVSVGVHERAGGIGVDDAGDWYMPDGMHDVTAAVPVLTVSAAEVAARLPAAQFCPVDAEAKVTAVRGTVTMADVARVHQVREAVEKLAAGIAPGWGSSVATDAYSAPWLQVRGVVEDVWLRVAGACAEDACVDATLTTASCSYDTPVPSTRSRSRGRTAAEPRAWVTCTVHVNDLAVAQVSGKLEAVLPAAAPFVPGGMRAATLRAVRVHVSMDPLTGAPLRLAGEACGLSVTADPPVSARSGFWDAAAGADVCVIGACTSSGSGHRCSTDVSSGGAPGLAASKAATEAVIRFEFTAPGISCGGAPTSAVTAATTAVLLRNVRVSTLFLAEVFALIDAKSPTEDGRRGTADGRPRAAEAGGSAACVSVEIVGCELVSLAQPAGAVRGSDGDAAVKLGRVRVIWHPGLLDDHHAVATAALAEVRMCACQAEGLKGVPAEQVALALGGALGGTIWEFDH